MKVAPKISEALYQDVIARGGLANALQSVLREIGSSLVVSELDADTGIVCALVESGPRSCQIYIDDQKRLFFFKFRARGVELAHANTSDLVDAAEVIHGWVLSTCNAAELAAAFKFVAIEKQAAAFECGEKVEEQWRQLRKSCIEEMPEVEPILQAAYQRRQLRQLSPYTSKDRVHFSRCTDYPYTSDVPYLFPLLGEYVAVGPTGALLGHGNVEEAVELVLANMPPNCGPAVLGTADDMVDAEPGAQVGSTSAVMEDPAKCGCNRSMAVICAVFASAAVAALLAEDRCLDTGGRLSDVPWSCEFPTGAIASLWSLVTPAIAGTVLAFVAIPVYFAVSAIGRRWIFAYGKRHG